MVVFLCFFVVVWLWRLSFIFPRRASFSLSISCIFFLSSDHLVEVWQCRVEVSQVEIWRLAVLMLLLVVRIRIDHCLSVVVTLFW